MSLGFKIQFLNINESYFKGKVEFQNKEYTINIQNERRGKVLKLPFYINSKKERMLVRLTGSGHIFIEDYLPFKGESEWVEIDSDEITFYIADHQDKFDTLEVVYE
ncbi:MAG: hypothetical protein O6746_02835 [Thaumarchaeota archaeon]|nr:hypothetical protein [Nitrososphaerota archaeon]